MLKRKSVRSTILRVILLLVSAAVLTAAVFISTDPKKDFLEERAVLVVRQIGHHLLLHAGDSTSRILPVKQPLENVFQLEFQNQFSFVPDSLVAIVQRNLASADLPLRYRVSVFDCVTEEMTYGFEIGPGNGDILSCQGRAQPYRCYRILIAFLPPENSTVPASLYYAAFAGLLGITLVIASGKLFRKPADIRTEAAGKVIGIFTFNEQQGILKTATDTIQLSDKETKLMRMLAANMNNLTARDHLLKEVWENEGVITGRSLDMFVSKLRKKLSQDPAVRITNVHGQGYKLEIVHE